MDFFTKHDWFDRPGPYQFTLEHFMFILLSILVGVLLCFLLMKKDKKIIRRVLIILWLIAVGVEVGYYAVEYYLCFTGEYTFNFQTMLPLHSCSMFMYVFPIAIWAKNPVIKKAASNFLVVVNMIMGFITMFVGCPGPGYSTFSFHGQQILIYHALIFIVPLIMVVTNYYDLEKNDYRYGIGFFLILALAMWIFDAISGSDYFYIYDGKNFGVLYEISENVPHLVWTLITVSCYVITALIIHFLIFGVKYWIKKKKEQKVDEPSQIS